MTGPALRRMPGLTPLASKRAAATRRINAAAVAVSSAKSGSETSWRDAASASGRINTSGDAEVVDRPRIHAAGDAIVGRAVQAIAAGTRSIAALLRAIAGHAAGIAGCSVALGPEVPAFAANANSVVAELGWIVDAAPAVARSREAIATARSRNGWPPGSTAAAIAGNTSGARRIAVGGSATGTRRRGVARQRRRKRTASRVIGPSSPSIDPVRR